ncbi:hypothetical protein Q5424_22275 [Conexibacter sp. JD483]|uniref:hypothetical protein n=1 Tax=unclassified Conexibacter TaxID=2627773 RepID=UPI00271FFC2E|nr:MULTISPECIES: hypothetical protein [unclassified Conexibacter]MDO8189133.1 hypothetical protein [Conexibacter sp. CPCC 205706]MDO8201849.1 hypothetical protein [Conexibacter sp. CPCC 205762]MDR9371841.1 hypothetical protein [Conexibacter sp. JD483]
MPSSSPRAAVVALAVAALAAVAVPAEAAPRVSLQVQISGLPKGQAPAATLRGPGIRGATPIRRASTTLRGLKPGRYVLTLRRVQTRGKGIPAGSVALPTQARTSVRIQRTGRGATLAASYGAIIRDGVQPAPRRIAAVQGAKDDPTGLVLPRGAAVPRAGAYFTSGPTRQLPSGLISRVTSVRRTKRGVIVGLRSVPVTEVVPEFHGWAPGAGTSSTQARAAGSTTVGPEPDLGKAIKFAKGLPCRLDTNVGQSGGAAADIQMGLRDPRIEQLEWGVLHPRVHLRLSGAWFVGWRLNDGDALKCSETLDGFTQIVAVPIGPVVVPFFFGAKIAIKTAMTQTGGPVTADHAVALTIDADSDRGVANWLQATATPQSRIDGQVALDLQAQAGFYVEAGVGLPKVANVKVELGPELVAQARYDGTCQAEAKLSGKLVAELVVRTFTFDMYSRTFLGPMALLGCKVVDPILGDWRYNDGGGDLRITANPGGGFTATALNPNTINGGDCVYRPTGSQFAIAGADGSYTSEFSWWRLPDCVKVDADPAATLKIAFYNRDKIDFCGRTPRNWGCDTLSRIRR